MKNQHILCILATLLLGILPASSQVPQLVNFQGRVAVDGENFSGVGFIKVAIINPDRNATLWSNDGTSVNMSEPADALKVTITNGLYAILLGDATLNNMTVLPASVFGNENLWVRVWFDDDVNGSQLLVPDRRIAAVGYAMMAASVDDGAITTSKLAANSVTSGKIGAGQVRSADIAPNAVDSVHIAANAVTGAKLAADSVNSVTIINQTVDTADLALNAVTNSRVLDGSLIGDDLAGNTVTGVQLADTLDLGSTTADGTLNVWDDGSDVNTIRLIGGSSQISTYGSDGLEQARLWGLGYGELQLRDDQVANDIAAAIGAAQFLSPGGYLELRHESDLRVQLKANTSTGGNLNLYQTDGELGVNFNGFTSSAGRGTIYQADAMPSMLFSGSSNAITLYQNDDQNGVILDGESGGGGAAWLYQADGDLGIFLDAENAGAGWVSIRHSDGNARVSLDGESTGSGGEITVRDGNGTETVEILGAEGTDLGGRIRIRDEAGTIAVQLRDDKTEGGGELHLYNGAGTRTILLEAQEVTSDGAQITLRNAAGDATLELDAEFGDGGPSRVTTGTVQITGGSDLSEQFEINPSESISTPEPGMIVCIDAERPGELKPSSTSHDRTVAGIISGAGGVHPGLLMGQRDSLADGEHPVALTGRVYCKMDASYGPIEPGDLITTSDTPGHGMKVTDHDQARGAIIGKAMTGLDEGTGLVLVLVSLQ